LAAVVLFVLAAVGIAPMGGVLPAASAAGQTPVFRNQDKWAVVVGIDKHRRGSPRTNVGAVGDANDMVGMLHARGFEWDHILVLTDAQATGANIRTALQWLVDRSGPQTLSVFHYSGHIKQQSGDKDRDGEALDEFLWPYDSKFIADSELASYIKRLRGWSWTSIAGCEAAGLDDGINSPVRFFTGSSLEHQKSYEYPAWKNSVWMGLLAERALGNNEADLNRDGRISLREAYEWAAPHAERITSGQKKGKQTPYYNGGGNLYLDRPPGA
jgi:hypothetical protein